MGKAPGLVAAWRVREQLGGLLLGERQLVGAQLGEAPFGSKPQQPRIRQRLPARKEDEPPNLAQHQGEVLAAVQILEHEKGLTTPELIDDHAPRGVGG